jgi:uncharacterized membrane protein
MKFSWRTDWPMWAMIAGMFLLAALTWNTAPDRIPVHWGWSGDVDRYGGKVEGLVMLPLLTLFIYVMMTFMPRIDPGRRNYEQFAGAYLLIRIAVIAVMAVIYGAIHLWIRGHRVAIETIVPLVIGALFVLIGSVLGKVRPNWFFGVRTPWTLSSKLSWSKTHRLAGWVFVALGLCLMASGVSRSRIALVVTLAIGGAGVLWTIVYSYLVWRGDPNRIPPAGTLPAG